MYSKGICGKCPHKNQADVGQCDVLNPGERGISSLLPGHLHRGHTHTARTLPGQNN